MLESMEINNDVGTCCGGIIVHSDKDVPPTALSFVFVSQEEAEAFLSATERCGFDLGPYTLRDELMRLVSLWRDSRKRQAETVVRIAE